MSHMRVGDDFCVINGYLINLKSHFRENVFVHILHVVLEACLLYKEA